MPEPTLAFLQNFYTDVTLYMPAEPEVEAVSAAAPVKPQAPAPLAAVPPALAAPAPVPAVAPAPVVAPALAPAAETQAAAASPGLPSLSAAPPRRIPAAPTPAPAAAQAPGPTPAPAEPAVPPVMLVTFATQGSRPDGLVLLVRLPHEQFLKLPRNVFLNKMLQALGLVMADVVLVNVESHLPVALANLRRELAATRIIAFGKNLLDTTIRNTQIYEPVQFPSLGLSFLASAEIELLEYDVSLKKRLWAGLQRMFPR